VAADVHSQVAGRHEGLAAGGADEALVVVVSADVHRSLDVMKALPHVSQTCGFVRRIF
jgi:hypothetical protein